MDTLALHLTDIDSPPHRLAVRQGATYLYPAMIYTGLDLRGWDFRGQIRTNYASLGGELVAAFVFGEVLFSETPDPSDDATLIPKSILMPRIDWEATRLMDPTGLRPRDSVDQPFRPGVNCWVYDIEAELDNKVVRLAEGFVQVNLEVTVPLA